MRTKETFSTKIVSMFKSMFKNKNNEKDLIGHGYIDIPGYGVIYGGPYLDIPSYMQTVGVKMAKEINYPCRINVPTEDFSVPTVSNFELGLIKAAYILKEHGRIYVGCAGGTGRTGLFMAGMVKLLMPKVEELVTPINGIPACVAYVRDKYKVHAVETDQQVFYISKLDTKSLREIFKL